MGVFIVCWFILLKKWLRKKGFLSSRPFHRFSRRKPGEKKEKRQFGHREKPLWVKKEIIRLKALMPDYGCRKIADVFNRKFLASKKMSVSKTYVNSVIRDNQYAIAVLRKDIRNRKPRRVPRNLVWGMDLTGKTDGRGKLHMMAGIIDHGTRACLLVEALQNKSSSNLLYLVMKCVKQYGFPKFIRTDNEAIFTSALFRTGLFLLGIRHQRSDVACPWQNGRIERFFGTLKERMNQLEVGSFDCLQEALIEYRFWYNFVRPHQSLDGKTPAEAWGMKRKWFGRKEYWFEAWDGLLKGFYFP